MYQSTKAIKESRDPSAAIIGHQEPVSRDQEITAGIPDAFLPLMGPSFKNKATSNNKAKKKKKK
jgi:hypothetical protein